MNHLACKATFPYVHIRRWGYPVLWNAYLYHLGRLDHRHNFSPYFYPTYLSYPSNAQQGPNSPLTLTSYPLLSFVPQMSLAIGTGFLLGRRTSDLPFAWFVQTMIFVTFNKVCTSQVCDLHIYDSLFVLMKKCYSTLSGIFGSCR